MTQLPRSSTTSWRGVRRTCGLAAALVLTVSLSGCSLFDPPKSDPQAPTPTATSSPSSASGGKGRVDRPEASGDAHVPGFVAPQLLVPAMDTYTQESAGGEVFAAAWSSSRAGRVTQLVRSLSYANRHLRLDKAELGDGAVRLTGQGLAGEIVAATGEGAFASEDSTVVYTIDVVPAREARLTMVRVIGTVVNDVAPVTGDAVQ